jgi:hypothetical protein
MNTNHEMQPTYEERQIMTQNTTATETTAPETATLDDVLLKRAEAAKKLHENCARA